MDQKDLFYMQLQYDALFSGFAGTLRKDGEKDKLTHTATMDYKEYLQQAIVILVMQVPSPQVRDIIHPILKLTCEPAYRFR
jgi:hypothetical protein